jgi:hypothetical protein
MLIHKLVKNKNELEKILILTISRQDTIIFLRHNPQQFLSHNLIQLDKARQTRTIFQWLYQLKLLA